MTVREIIKRYNLRVTARQRRACVYLERRGYMFCGEFGYQNAKDLARKVRANGGHLRTQIDEMNYERRVAEARRIH